MSTQDAFERWFSCFLDTIISVFSEKEYISQKRKMEIAWQACQAHNDTVIAEMAKQAEINQALYRDDITELKENLRIVKSAADAEALEVDSRGKLIAELVEALEGSRDDVASQLDQYAILLPHKQHRYDAQKETLDKIDTLIAKHKGQS